MNPNRFKELFSMFFNDESMWKILNTLNHLELTSLAFCYEKPIQTERGKFLAYVNTPHDIPKKPGIETINVGSEIMEQRVWFILESENRKLSAQALIEIMPDYRYPINVDRSKPLISHVSSSSAYISGFD